MEKVYPVDIYGIKQIGIEKWLDNYFVPLSGLEYQNIYKDVYYTYLSLLKDIENEPVYWVFVSNIFFTHLMSRFIERYFRLKRLKEKGYQYIIGKDKYDISELLTDFNFLVSLSKSKLIGTGVSNITNKDVVKNLLRTIRYNIPDSLNKDSIKGLLKPAFLAGNKFQSEVTMFCKHKKLSPISIEYLLQSELNFLRYGFARSFYSEDEKRVIDDLISNFIHIIRKKYPIITNKFFDQLQERMSEELHNSLLLFNLNVKILKKFKPNILLTTGLSHALRRIFCSAWRYSGGKVYGFVHGNSFCYIYSRFTINDLLSVDHYIAASKGSESVINQAAQDFSTGLKLAQIDCITTNEDHIALFDELQKDEKTNKIKKVMVVGPQLLDNYYIQWYPAFHSFALIDVSLRVLKVLKDAGYYVIFKDIPTTPGEISEIFEGYANQVIKERFEDTYNAADCFLFVMVNTSAFGFSLFTKKPIVIFSDDYYTWHPEVYELLNKRCAVVKTRELDGRVIFDKGDVVKAVEASLGKMDYDIIEKYAF